MPEVLVTVNELRVHYGSLVAVDGVSLEAAAGEIVALLGPNGAGKTSTVETIEGYRRPTSGQVRVCGFDPVADHHKVVDVIGVMLQSGGIPNQMRVGEALQQYASFYPNPLDPADLIERVGLAHRARATWRQLSGGEQQRLSLALALMGRPRVAFLDEPTAGIDPAGRQVVRDLVAGLRTEGVCVVLTTHDLADVEHLADRVVIMDRGRVLADGTPAELTGGSSDSFRFTAEAGLACSELAGAIDAAVSETNPGRYVVAAAPTPTRMAALTSWLARHDITLGGLQAGSRTLEEVFLDLTGPDADGRPPQEQP